MLDQEQKIFLRPEPVAQPPSAVSREPVDAHSVAAKTTTWGAWAAKEIQNLLKSLLHYTHMDSILHYARTYAKKISNRVVKLCQDFLQVLPTQVTKYNNIFLN